MSSLYTYNKQQFNSDVSFNGITTFNNTSTQITSSGTVGLRGVGGVDISSGGVISINGTSVKLNSNKLDMNTDGYHYIQSKDNGTITGPMIVGYLGGSLGQSSAVAAGLDFSPTLTWNGNNVGIGTTTPAQKLDVSGTIAIRNGGYYTTIGCDARYTSANTFATFINNDKTSGHLYLNTSSPSSNVIVQNGNVGIGTTNPAYKLDVTGTTRLNGAVITNANNIDCGIATVYAKWHSSAESARFTSASGYTTYINNDKSSGHLEINASSPNSNMYLSNGHFYFGANTSILKSDGSVGIGNASPGYKLDVTGNTRLNGSVDCGAIGCGAINAYHNISIYSGFGLWVNAGGNIYCDGNLTFNNSRIFLRSSDGRIGCGNSDPLYPITVSSHNGEKSIYAEKDIFSNRYMWSHSYLNASDTRIKTNIIDIDDSIALSILRKIQPKTYEYVDKKDRGNDSVIGFIAQEIQVIIPKAVTLNTKYIPNFYTNCQVASTDVSNIVLVTSPIDLSWNPLHDASGNAFIDADGNACSDASGNKVFKVRLHDQSNNEIDCKSTSILDKRSFLMDISGSKMVDASGNILLENDGGYFLYGQEVDDFHFIDKNAIFTVVTAAVQDIDRIVQAQEAKISALEQQIASLQTQNTAFEARLAALESK